MTISYYLSSVFTLCEFELRKVRHDSSQVWLRSGPQPVLWLLVFGTVFSQIRGDHLRASRLSSVHDAGGFLAQSVMFVAIFYGINVVWERDLGILNKLLSDAGAPLGGRARQGASWGGGARHLPGRGCIDSGRSSSRSTLISNCAAPCSPYFFIVVLFGMCFSSLSMSLAPISVLASA